MGGWGVGTAVKEALNRHMFIIALRFAPTLKKTQKHTTQPTKPNKLNKQKSAKIQVPSVDNRELSKVLLLKPGIDHNMAVYTSSAARNFLTKTCTFPAHPTSYFSPNHLPIF